jgi:hypothetical protein
MNGFSKSQKLNALLLTILIACAAAILFQGHRLREGCKAIKVAYRLTQELFVAANGLDKEPLIIDMYENILKAESTEKKDYVLASIFLRILNERKGSFEALSGKLSESETDFRKVLIAPIGGREDLKARLSLEYTLIAQNKNTDALALARELDLANKPIEASPLWKRHLDLIKIEYGSTSSNYSQCSKALASHELVK